MTIRYTDTKEFAEDELESLFLSVQWSSGHYPARLVRAINGSDSVFSAWEGDLLLGLVNALDDGEMTAYIHYMLVRPQYHHKGIGQELIRLMKEKYSGYLRIALISYDKETEFYKRCGFVKSTESSPMFITSLWS